METSGHFTLAESAAGALWIEGHQIQLEHGEEDKYFLIMAGTEPRFLCRPAHSLIITATQQSQLVILLNKT
jgi:hypothetical protein